MEQSGSKKRFVTKQAGGWEHAAWVRVGFEYSHVCVQAAVRRYRDLTYVFFPFWAFSTILMSSGDKVRSPPCFHLLEKVSFTFFLLINSL